MQRSRAVRERRWGESEIKLILESSLPIQDLMRILNRTEGSINMIRRKAQMVIDGRGNWETDSTLEMIRRILLGKYAYLR